MAPNQPNMTVKPLTNEDLDAQHDLDNQRQDELDATVGASAEDGEQPFVQDEGTTTDGDPEPQARPREKPVTMSPQDLKRQAMIDRFKRPGLIGPFDGDMNNPEALHGEVSSEVLEPDPDADEPGVPRGQSAPQEPDVRSPRMITQTIRGKAVTLSEDEWLERARKVEAADSYLDESRVLLETAKEIRAERAGQVHRPNDGQTSTQDDESDASRAPAPRPNEGLDLKAVVEKIQFGDPAEAAEELGRVIQTVATQQAEDGQIKRLIANDLAKSQADLKAFLVANPDLAKDKLASVAIENTIYDIYREELLKVGLDEAQIPKDSKSVADWHRFYRVHGHDVSKTSDILTRAKDRFVEWRGGSPTPNPTPKPRQGAPRVAVNVDRTERRQAIPLQPTRAVAPRRNEAPAKTPDQSRKEAVAEMRRQRGQIT